VAGGGIAHLLDRQLRLPTLVAVARHGGSDGRVLAQAAPLLHTYEGGCGLCDGAGEGATGPRLKVMELTWSASSAGMSHSSGAPVGLAAWARAALMRASA